MTSIDDVGFSLLVQAAMGLVRTRFVIASAAWQSRHRSNGGSPTGVYAVAYSTARTNWDAADTPADFVYNGSQNFHSMGAAEMNASEPNGVLNYWCNNSRTTSAECRTSTRTRTIRWNATTNRRLAS